MHINMPAHQMLRVGDVVQRTNNRIPGVIVQMADGRARVKWRQRSNGGQTPICRWIAITHLKRCDMRMEATW